MPINLRPELEAILRARAEGAGISVETYLERIARDEQTAGDELETLALEGIRSGNSIEVGPDYWEEKHRRLDERLRKTASLQQPPHPK